MTDIPVPHVNWLDGIPEDERPTAQHVSSQLYSLHTHVCNFGYGLEVVDESSALLGDDHDRRARGIARMQMAAHYGALAVYHFQSTLLSIKHCLTLCPSLQRLVDVKALAAAIEKFKKDFPDFNNVRHGVAHLADQIFKPDKIERLRHEEGSAILHGTLVGRKLTFTAEGRYISIEMSDTSLEILATIQFECFGSFRKACGPRQTS